MYIHISNLSKSFQEKTILTEISLDFSNNHYGIIGINGVGKTTLLKLINGEIKPDSGTIQISPGTVAYQSQFIETDNDLSIEEYVIGTFPNISEVYTEIIKLTDQKNPSLVKLAELQQQFEEKGGYIIQNDIYRYMSILHLEMFKPEDKISKLSGGQKTRLQLLPLFMKDYDILLLDEPTNNLDAGAIEILKSYIKNHKGITIVVSHDRNFLNSVSNKIIEIVKSQCFLYSGNYDEYERQKNIKIQKDRLIYTAKSKNNKRLENTANKRASEAQSVERNLISGAGIDVIRRRTGKKAKSAKVMRLKIEKNINANMPEKHMNPINIKFDLKESSGSQLVCKIRDLSFKYDSYIFKNFSYDIWSKDRIALQGNNGTGKSTLLRLIMHELEPTEGSIVIGKNTKISYFSQNLNILNQNKNVLENFLSKIQMSTEDARTFLYFMLFENKMVYQEVSSLSPGEKSRLVLAILLAQDSNFLILDEPTNNLDIASIEVIEKALKNYNKTILCVSHDNYFLEQIGINSHINIDNKSKN